MDCGCDASGLVEIYQTVNKMQSLFAFYHDCVFVVVKDHDLDIVICWLFLSNFWSQIMQIL